MIEPSQRRWPHWASHCDPDLFVKAYYQACALADADPNRVRPLMQLHAHDPYRTKADIADDKVERKRLQHWLRNGNYMERLLVSMLQSYPNDLATRGGSGSAAARLGGLFHLLESDKQLRSNALDDPHFPDSYLRAAATAPFDMGMHRFGSIDTFRRELRRYRRKEKTS